MNRRQFLGRAGAATTLGLAGCSRLDSGGRDGVVLTHIELGNATGDPRVFDVVVVYDDVVLWSSYEVDGGADGEMGGRVIDVDTPEDPGSVEVHVRVGETWRSTDFDSDRYDGERVIVVATYGMTEDDLLRLSRVRSDRSTPTGERASSVVDDR